MIKIKASIDGKEVPLSEFGSGIERKIYLAAADAVRERLEAVKCPEHGTPLDALILKKAEHGNLGFDLEGCCQKLVEACEAELA